MVLTAVGVPEIKPVAVSKVRPAGRVPDNEYEVASEPVLLIVYRVPMSVLTVFVNALGESVKTGADVAVTVSFKVTDTDEP
jgi:hypothetical protein